MTSVDQNIHPHASGKAADLVERHKQEEALVFFSGWFCPFVQRVWISLEEKKLPYKYFEINPYKKEKEFLKINPRGLVPAVAHHGRALYESLVICEYLEEAFPDTKRLLPGDAYERARIRIWIDHVAKKLIPAFYRAMQAQEAEQQRSGIKDLVGAFQDFLDNVQGPFFSGNDFSLADIVIAPWIVRLYILRENRGFRDEELDSKWLEYRDRIANRRSVLETSSDPANMVDIYQRYLTNTTQSEVGKATRGGQSLP